MYAALNVLFILLTLWLVPETKHVSLEHIERNLMNCLLYTSMTITGMTRFVQQNYKVQNSHLTHKLPNGSLPPKAVSYTHLDVYKRQIQTLLDKADSYMYENKKLCKRYRLTSEVESF